MSGTIGTFLVGLVAGVGVSEFYGPFFRSGAKNDLQKAGRSIKSGAKDVYEEAKDKAEDLKNSAKDKYEDVKADLKKK